MLNIGVGEWIVLAIVLLVVVGPEQLPGMVRRSGKVIGQLRSFGDQLKTDFDSSMSEIESATDFRSWTDPDANDSTEDDDPPRGATEVDDESDLANNADPDDELDDVGAPISSDQSDQSDEGSQKSKTISSMPRNFLTPSQDLDWVSSAPGPFAASRPANEASTAEEPTSQVDSAAAESVSAPEPDTDAEDPSSEADEASSEGKPDGETVEATSVSGEAQT